MSELLALFANNLLPILLAAGSGFLISHLLDVSPRSLSQVIFYIFSPCLIFNLIANSQLSGSDILRMMLVATLVILLVGMLTWLAGRALRLERRMLAAVLLTSMFMNAGNFGLSLNLFAFGPPALPYASLYFVTSAMLTYTVGVIIASMGRTNLKQALINLMKIPTVYALILAFIFLRTGWKLPMPLERTTSLLADATIPSMLVLLGLQLRNVRWNGQAGPLAVANIMRLLVGPALAFGFSLLLGIQGIARQAGIVESAMPSAVLTTVLATEYDVEAPFVTSVVFVTTLLSLLTLTPLIAVLGK